MITKIEFQKLRSLDISPYLMAIEDSIRSEGFFHRMSINLGYIDSDRITDFKVQIGLVMQEAGWKSSFEMADGRDGCGDLYMSLS